MDYGLVKMASVFWFRRDLRLQDNEALAHALDYAYKSSDNTVYACYLLDHHKYEQLEGIRQHSITEGLKALDATIDGNL